jgi:hypothetical protein
LQTGHACDHAIRKRSRSKNLKLHIVRAAIVSGNSRRTRLRRVKIFAKPEVSFTEVVAAFGVDANALDSHIIAKVESPGLMIVLGEKNGAVHAEYIFRAKAAVVRAEAGCIGDDVGFGTPRSTASFFITSGSSLPPLIRSVFTLFAL